MEMEPAPELATLADKAEAAKESSWTVRAIDAWKEITARIWRAKT